MNDHRHKLNRERTAENIRDRIRSSGKSVKMIAEAAGVKERNIRNYMRGDSLPRINVLYGIACELGVGTNELLAFDLVDNK